MNFFFNWWKNKLKNWNLHLPHTNSFQPPAPAQSSRFFMIHSLPFPCHCIQLPHCVDSTSEYFVKQQTYFSLSLLLYHTCLVSTTLFKDLCFTDMCLCQFMLDLNFAKYSRLISSLFWYYSYCEWSFYLPNLCFVVYWNSIFSWYFYILFNQSFGIVSITTTKQSVDF